MDQEKYMDKIYEIIIIGAGPAGITAGVYAARKKMDLLVLSGDIGGQISWTNDIENYTGYLFITGIDMISKFQEHIKKYNIEIKENETVVDVIKQDDLILIKTKERTYKAKTVIIASGKRPRQLNVTGEKTYKNKGVAYCATCEGPLFSGKDVIVVGGGNSALEAVIQLSKIAGNVYVINNMAEFTGDKILSEAVEKADNVKVYNDSQVLEIKGDKFVSSVECSQSGKNFELKVQGFFVEIGLDPNSEFINDIRKNERNEIIINSLAETSIIGIFAAGDVTNIVDKQIVIAAGEGAKAALGAFRYLVKQGG